MAEKNIIMKQANATGGYDVLYPETKGEQVKGLTFDLIQGDLPSNRIEGTIPSSQITGLPTSLPADGGNADTVGGLSAAEIISQAVSSGCQIEVGSYVGTGAYGVNNPNSLSASFPIKIGMLFNKSGCLEEPIASGVTDDKCIGITSALTEEYNSQNDATFWRGYYDNKWAQYKISSDGKTIFWFHQGESEHPTQSTMAQFNLQNVTYRYALIG